MNNTKASQKSSLAREAGEGGPKDRVRATNRGDIAFGRPPGHHNPLRYRFGARKFTLALVFLAAAQAVHAKSKQVILMIGDGMGMSVVGLAQIENDLLFKRGPLNLKLAMDEGRIGFVNTYSADRLVTDSAAAATAMATGRKTNNDVVGLDENGAPLNSLLELAQGKGLSAGIVTTDSLTGATAGAFTAHASHRGQESLIGEQQIRGRFTVLLGGGRKNFVMANAQAAGYSIMNKRKDLLDPKALSRPLWLGVFYDKEFPYIAERSNDVPSLPEMTEKALAKLSQDADGFLLVIEGARIDHAAHSNEKARMLDEFLEFDQALGVVLAFLKKNPKSTLFLTADHDTGGFALSKADRRDDYPSLTDLRDGRGTFWISQNHTAEPVLLLGAGADGDSAGGWHDNTDIFHLIKNSLGL